MATDSMRPTGPMPRLLKSTYLAGGEQLLRETRATKLYFFPGPIFGLIVFGILDYADFAALRGLPGIPYLTAAFARVPTSPGNFPTYVLLFLLFLTLVVFLWLTVRYFRWVTNVYAITTHRVIIQRGILGREFDEIPVTQVRGVDVRQSAGQRMLGYGTVRVSSESGVGLGNEDWEGIPKPFEFQKLIETAGQNLAARTPGATM
jgi:hypothetical protein